MKEIRDHSNNMWNSRGEVKNVTWTVLRFKTSILIKKCHVLFVCIFYYSVWTRGLKHAARQEFLCGPRWDQIFKKYQNLWKSWGFYARNGQKLALKATWMKKKHHIWQGVWPSEPSSINCGPQGTFSFYLHPAEHFFMLMRPLSGFELETPGVNKKKYFCQEISNTRRGREKQYLICSLVWKSYQLACKMLVKFTPAINFINVKRVRILYERHFGSFFLPMYVCMYEKNCQNDILQKSACLTLMKLTPRGCVQSTWHGFETTFIYIVFWMNDIWTHNLLKVS